MAKEQGLIHFMTPGFITAAAKFQKDYPVFLLEDREGLLKFFDSYDGPAHAGSRLKLGNGTGRRRLKRQPSSRTGENSPYGMRGGIEETSASFEARTAPRSYPTIATIRPGVELQL